MEFEIIKDWQVAGLRCVLIKRSFEYDLTNIPETLKKYSMSLWFTGYALIEPGHKLHGLGSESVGHLDVHGGVTYAGFPDWGVDKNDSWAFGWDSAHGTEYDQNMAIVETAHLARQLT